MAAFLAVYAWMILTGEDFAMFDNSQFTVFSLRGVNLPVHQEGRFSPLSLQEFNVVGHFTKTIAGYHSLAIAQLVILALILFDLFRDGNSVYRCSIVCLALVIPGVVISFTGLIYPERNVLFLLACLVWFVRRFDETFAVRYAVGAVVAVQLMLYCKEPAFLLVLGFCGARVLFRWMQRAGGPDWRGLDPLLIAASVGFLVLFAIMRFRQGPSAYLAARQVPVQEVLRYYLHVDPLAWALSVAAVVRVVRMVRGRTVAMPIWDALACGGVLYFVAYLGLRMVSPYYLAPVDFVAVLYLGRLLHNSWGTMRPALRVFATALALIVVCRGLMLSAFYVLERKLIIRQKVAIAELVREVFDSNSGDDVNLSFPLTSPYLLSEFASYLSYRGLPVEEDAKGSLRGRRVHLISPNLKTDGRCVAWRPFVCHAGPATGATLTIVLPEDARNWERYRAYSEQMHTRDPRTRPPMWLSQVFGFLAVHKPS